MMKIFAIFGVLLCATLALSEITQLLDLPPDEAQSIIDKQDLSLKYAPKVDSNVPALRYLGDELHEVLEDIYQARQFHGQDGLGGYVYGYSVPDIAKAEKKTAGGDLKGSYSYVNGQGQEIKVEYWDDGTGFHQIDNVPQVAPKQVTDTPEVQAAKDEFFRIWQEQATRNKAAGFEQPQDNTEYDDSARYAYDPEKDPWNKPYVPTKEELEPPKDPKGFFYQFDYPAGIIVEKGRAVSGDARKAPIARRSPEDQFAIQNELYNKNREILNGALKNEGVKDSRLSLRAANFGAIPVAAVHDQQVPHYLRGKIVDVQKSPVYFHQRK